MFWIAALSVALAAAFLIALPLFAAERAPSSAGTNDAEVYRDQLAELDRDQAAGLVGKEEAGQARAEIARRLIAASEAGPARSHKLGGMGVAFLAVFLCVFLPAAAAAIYLRTGIPDAPDLPLQARLADPDPDINILIAKTEAHLAAKPDDGRGWELLAPIYMRQMRGEDAANAYRKAILLLGPDAVRYGSLGEALVAAATGKIGKDAREAFQDALKLDPADPRARFYLALASAEDGKFDDALAQLAALRKDSAPDAPWLNVIAVQAAQITAARDQAAKAPGNPDAADIEAAQGLNETDRMQMIRTMVDGLDARLTDDPNNHEGWLRLVRSYGVLGEPEKASAALTRALKAFPAETDEGKALLALAKETGVKIEETP